MKVKVINCPCRNCQERSAFCHSTCPKYAEYEKYNNQLRKKRFESNLANSLFVDDVIKANSKRKRKK